MREICRICKEQFQPSAHNIRRYDWICKPCNATKHRGYAQRRRDAGLSSYLPLDPKKREAHLKRMRDYLSQPEVKKRRAASMRRYVRDPRLRLRHESRWILRRAIAAGRIKKGPCFVCGREKVHGHHDDYSQPLKVEWLCLVHHRERHARFEGRK